jgi:phospho-N-acetylmuramoyl-pentapeptide-transferase
MMTALIAVVAAFFAGMLIAPAYIRFARRTRSSQTILSYVDQHADKKDTPTMGGIVFILATIGVTLAFGGYKSRLCLVILLIFFAYGVIGFLDDFIKVKLKRNKGLKAYQKVIAQLAVAITAAYFCSKSPYIGTKIALPIVGGEADLGVWYIPFAAFVFLAMSNAVNLTDGLDGLAGSSTVAYMVTFTIIIALLLSSALADGQTLYAEELNKLAVFACSLIGALLAFLWYNSYRASMFMGDTGSLSLGGAVAAIALFVRNPLISAFVGIMYVVSCVSVILQVAVYKTKGKRVFLMSPFHHHLELKGFNETKIVAFYGIITAIAGVVSLIIM